MLVTSEVQVPPKETSRAGTEERVVSISSKTVAEGKGDGEVTPSLCANRSLLNMCLRTEDTSVPLLQAGAYSSLGSTY